MGGRRRLRHGGVRLLGQHDGIAGRAFSRALAALVEELGPFTSKLQRLEASRVALAWANLELASRALAAARRAREQGKGRRPNAQQIERLARRVGLEDASYAAALDKLRELAAAARKPASMRDLVDAQRGRPA